VSSDVNGHTDIFVRDRRVARTVRVSVQDGTGLHGNGDSSAASISADGLHVAFVSEATNLIGKALDNNSVPDVFVRDRQAGATIRVSVATDGAEADQSSYGPRISADGGYVAFESGATTLVTGDTNGSNDIFVHDLQMGATKRVSVTNAGGQANSYSGNPPGISADGRYVAFKSDATNLVSDDSNGYDDIFVRDTWLNTTRRVNVTGTGVQGDADCTYPSISADGRHVVFGAYAANLVPGDTNDSGDILVYTAPSSLLRVADRTRFSTAVAVAKAGYPGWAGVKHVIIASGDDRAAADPLAASGLCWAYDAPMLLVSAARTPDEVKAAVQQIVAKNGPITLHVVGGPVSVPAARLAELVAAGGGSGKVTIDRVLSTGGRYDMSAAIARRMKSVAAIDPGKTMPPVALFANGADATKFFDALALSPISAGNGAPILLVTATSVPPATAAVVAELAPTTKIVGGGPNTVSEAVRAQLGATRWSGQSRYDTAIAIADGAIANGWLLRSYVGLAAKLPDALTGGGFVGQRKGVLLLTDGANLTPVTKNWLTARKRFVAEVYLFGGPLSISDAVKTQVGNALQ
jgi:putative cell wall-binding protein